MASDTGDQEASIRVLGPKKLAWPDTESRTIRVRTRSGTRSELFLERSAKRGDTMRAHLFRIN
jgi:hypothetical protein